MGNNADDFETWAYMVKLANPKQSENVEPKESSMQKYLDKVANYPKRLTIYKSLIIMKHLLNVLYSN